MPVTATVREVLQSLIGRGVPDEDSAALLLPEAKGVGIKLKEENVKVHDRLKVG